MGILARLSLLWRHNREVVLFGFHWKYCNHRSHVLNLRCWRWFNYDGFCVKHNGTCWSRHG